MQMKTTPWHIHIAVTCGIVKFHLLKQLSTTTAENNRIFGNTTCLKHNPTSRQQMTTFDNQF